jgi:hypothetical protein
MRKAKEHVEDLKKIIIQLKKSENSLVVIPMQLDMSDTMLHICQGVFVNEQGSRDN